MSLSRDKGARGEVIVRDYLREKVGLPFERTPNSGASGIKGMKGDLFLPNMPSPYTIEVKFYESDELSSSILNKKGTFISWWEQTVREAKQNDNAPMLIYRWNRSKLFVCVLSTLQTNCSNYIEISSLGCRIYLADELNLKVLFKV